MKNLFYKEKLEKLLTPDICRRLFLLHEYRGRQKLLIGAKPILEMLRGSVATDSVYSMCSLERIHASRFRSAVNQPKSRVMTKADAAIAGYFDSFQILEGRHGAERFNVDRIGEIYTELFFLYFDSYEHGYRNITPKAVLSIPSPAEMLPSEEIGKMLTSMCAQYLKTRKNRDIDELLLISVFLVDFICVFPYREGFTRLFLLVTRLLLKRAGYLAVDYVSFEALFAKEEKKLQEAVFNSTIMWNSGENDYSYFTVFFLDVLVSVYEKFELFADNVPNGNPDAIEKVRALFMLTGKPLQRQEISACVTTVTPDRIKQILHELLAEGFLVKSGVGKATAYMLSRAKQ